jgi:hypothetical protein
MPLIIQQLHVGRRAVLSIILASRSANTSKVSHRHAESWKHLKPGGRSRCQDAPAAVGTPCGFGDRARPDRRLTPDGMTVSETQAAA